MVKKVATLLVAVSLLSFPWLGSAAYGQTPPAAQEVSSLQGTMRPTPQKQRSEGSSFQLLPEHIIGGP